MRNDNEDAHVETPPLVNNEGNETSSDHYFASNYVRPFKLK